MPTYSYNSDHGQIDLMGAAYNGDADEVAHILTMPCDIDAQDDHGMTALMYAALKGHNDALRQLIASKAALETQSGQHFTALMYAARMSQVETVKLLLQSGADPDVNEDYGTFSTPLTLAAGNGCFPIVRALVAAGADINLRGGYSQLTAECIARRCGHHDISEFLCYHEKKPTV
jgi:ankyrin repeat protein